MSTTGQYLQPEYLSPSAPFELDAKSNPLAMLMATCNSIGTDDTKLAGNGGSAGKGNSRERNTSGNVAAGGVGTGTGRKQRRHSVDSGSQTSSTCSTHSGGGGGRGSAHSTSPAPSPVPATAPTGEDIRDSPTGSEMKTARLSTTPRKEQGSNISASDNKLTPNSDKCDTDRLKSGLAGNNTIGHDNARLRSPVSNPVTRYSPSSLSAGQPLAASLHKHISAADVAKSSAAIYATSSAGLAHYAAAALAAASGLHGITPPSLMYPFSLLGGGGGVGGGAQASAWGSGLISAHKHNLESVRYTVVRTANGGSTVLPLCIDPYCTYCKLTLHAAQATPLHHPPHCACSQCASDKSPLKSGYPNSALNPSALNSSLLAGFCGLSGLPGYPSHSSSLLLSAGSKPSIGLPYVCSWMAESGSGVCGKQFKSSDDLMQHLKSHTATPQPPVSETGSDPSNLSPLAALPASAYLSLLKPSDLAASLGGVPPPSVDPAMAAVLRHAYEGSAGGRFSPTLLLESARYHPYLKSLSGGLGGARGPTGDSGPLAGIHPSLAAYSPLLSLYAQKLGVP